MQQFRVLIGGLGGLGGFFNEVSPESPSSRISTFAAPSRSYISLHPSPSRCNKAAMSETQKPIRARRRPVVSCEECRRRKIKCDRTHPCKHCRQLNAPCNYSDGVAPLNGQDVLVDTLRRISNPPNSSSFLPFTSSAHDNLSIASTRNQHPRQSTLTSWKSPNIREENSEDSPKVRALLEKVQQLEQLLSEYMPKEVPEDSTLSKSKEASTQLRGTLSKTRVFGQTHWMNLIGLVQSNFS